MSVVMVTLPILFQEEAGKGGMVFASFLLSGIEWSEVGGCVDGWGHGHLPTFLLEEEWR